MKVISLKCRNVDLLFCYYNVLLYNYVMFLQYHFFQSFLLIGDYISAWFTLTLRLNVYLFFSESLLLEIPIYIWRYLKLDTDPSYDHHVRLCTFYLLQKEVT